jgi:hypothetical protein
MKASRQYMSIAMDAISGYKGRIKGLGEGRGKER